VFPTTRIATVLPERLRLALTLLHVIPGAIGSLRTTDGSRFVVAHHRRDAVLTPCQLRAGLLEPVVDGVPHLSGLVVDLDVVGGVVDLGAGVYQRSHPSAGDERWFATTLGPDRVSALAQGCPTTIDHAEIAIRIAVDTDLAISAVCMTAPSSLARALDTAAWWLEAACLVEELIAPLADPAP
jgi:hypothetical protein